MAKEEPKIPEELLKALNTNPGLKRYYEKMPPSHRREYADYIADAEETETKERRVKKVIEMVTENRKMNEKNKLKNKYKKR